MKPSTRQTKQRGPSWSERLSRRYSLDLDAALADWFDDGVGSQLGTGEFNQGVAPEILLAEAPDVIWPGLMLPDTLPVLGNKYGDWLCIRVGADNRVAEVIHWYHGGGDWIPWGRTIAEAIVFDALHDSLPGRRQGHAIPAEPRRAGMRDDVLLQWALRWLAPAVRDWLAGDRVTELAERMLEADIARIAVHCELVLAALDSEFRQRMTPELAAVLNMDWEPDVVSWLFDNGLVSSDQRNAIQRHLQANVSFQQDWDAARKHCDAVCAQRSDLGWAWDVAGWAQERAGNQASAAEYYRRGAFALAFADQSIRFRTHWFPQSTGKFSVWRLRQCRRVIPAENPAGNWDTSTPQIDLTDRYLTQIQSADGRSLRPLAAAFWRDKGAEALEAGQAAAAYDAFYRGGWDLGIDDMSEYRQFLRLLTVSAKRAGQKARAAVAEAHLQTMLQRFGEG